MAGRVEAELSLDLFTPLAAALTLSVNSEVASQLLSWHPFARCATYLREGRPSGKQDIRTKPASSDGGEIGEPY